MNKEVNPKLAIPNYMNLFLDFSASNGLLPSTKAAVLLLINGYLYF
jgi:hypothetical protein